VIRGKALVLDVRAVLLALRVRAILKNCKGARSEVTIRM